MGFIQANVGTERTLFFAALFSIGSALSSGCDRIPPPESSAAARTELIGTWKYRGGNESVTISFTEDGIFRQIVGADRLRPLVTQTGTWKWMDDRVSLTDVQMCGDAGKWTAMSDRWWMIKSAERPGEFVLFGGSFPDPDVYREMIRVSPR